MTFFIHTLPTLMKINCPLIICSLTHNGEKVFIQHNLHLGSPTEENWICSECDERGYITGMYLKGTSQKGYDTLMDAVNDVKTYFGINKKS